MQNNMVNKLDNRMKTFKGIEVWGTMVKIRMVRIILGSFMLCFITVISIILFQVGSCDVRNMYIMEGFSQFH